MSTQFFDDLPPLPKGHVPIELAMALGLKSIPLPSFANMDWLVPGAYPSSLPASLPNIPEHPSQYHSALSGGNLALHDALTDPFIASHVAHQQSPQRPTSPPAHFALRWPSGSYHPDQYQMPHSGINPALAQGMSVFPQASSGPSISPESAYQPPDAHRSAAQPAWSVAGSLDPITGVFQRATDHPRLRTAQACEKCRIRKAKVCLTVFRPDRPLMCPDLQCSGEHPSCQRCRSRGLLCEYAPERRMRGPNKSKRKSVSGAAPRRRSSTPQSKDGGSPAPRRLSVISISSTSSAPEPEHHLPAAPPALSSPATPAPVAPPRTIAITPIPTPPQHSPAPAHMHFPASPLAPAQQPTAMQGSTRRPRPPPLHLGVAAAPFVFPAARLSPLAAPHLLARLTPASEAPPPRADEDADDATPTYAARRASLPAYLLAGAYPPHTHAFPPGIDAGSTGSREGSDAPPLTPLSLPDAMGMDFVYPDHDGPFAHLGGALHGLGDEHFAMKDADPFKEHRMAVVGGLHGYAPADEVVGRMDSPVEASA
ncbi:hypothetical protein WOLCODRAFT_159751 [Wolfiporia cocos MD-104 SS10]|uniref:Zn(2)-C6 fungal-type domain-containing protein n=1 Tax=Wolfiporia cocos (strain MD-104) TaxID=742152 RepID=A0A2H3ITF3_WOLCO|nr:hypothetical protein WOLCODRAFT_159751 [Wolfiporia cocos MD-104 SS10]